MICVAVTLGCTIGILVSPFPATVKILALFPIAVALLMVLLEEVLVARANLRRVQRRVQRRDDAVVEWLRDLNEQLEDDEEAWANWLGKPVETRPAPLATSVPILPRPLRSVVRVPKQRGPRAES